MRVPRSTGGVDVLGAVGLDDDPGSPGDGDMDGGVDGTDDDGDGSGVVDGSACAAADKEQLQATTTAAAPAPHFPRNPMWLLTIAMRQPSTQHSHVRGLSL